MRRSMHAHVTDSSLMHCIPAHLMVSSCGIFFESTPRFLGTGSAQPVTKMRPSGLSAQHDTRSVCPVRIARQAGQASSRVVSCASGFTGRACAACAMMEVRGASLANCRVALRGGAM